MIDVKILRTNPELVKANCVRRGSDVNVDEIVELDKQYLEAVQKLEEMQALRNRLSKECKTNPEAREQVKALKGELAELSTKVDTLKEEVFNKLSWLPNFLDPSVPEGSHDNDNEILRLVGENPTFDFKPRDHQELGEILDIIDTKRGAKVAQSGFYYWKGKGAILAQSMFFWVQKMMVERGFTLMMTPYAAKEKTLHGTGYLPFFADQTYKLEGEDLALIGTAEQTLVGYHADEMLNANELPMMYAAYTPCFRTESGSYGKESRGIFRVHQFNKVEQIIVCKPEDSPKYLEYALEGEEEILKALGLPYRVVNICIGDMGAPGYKKYDTEAWFPGYGGYRELTPDSNLTDFQSRRLNIRYKNAEGKREFVHTISATAVTDRCICAIMENFQQEDGTVIIPEVLRPYTGFDKIEPAK